MTSFFTLTYFSGVGSALSAEAKSSHTENSLSAKSSSASGKDEKALASAKNLIAKAVILERQKRYGEAEPLLKRALAIRKKVLGPNDLYVGQSLSYLGTLYVDERRYSKAEPLYKRAIAIYEKGPNRLDVAAILNDLASLDIDEGRFAEAVPLYKRVLATYEKTPNPNHLLVAKGLSDLALANFDDGRYTEAETLYKRALAIREKALGLNHPDVAAVLESLATLYEFEGHYAEAEVLYKRSVAIFKKAPNPDHLLIAYGLVGLAGAYAHQGRYTEAEVLDKRALAIREKALGPDHPDVAQSLNNLAQVYEFEGRYTEAEVLDKRALAIREKALRPDHPDLAGSLNNLAALYVFEGRYAKAEPLYGRALAICEKALGPNNPTTATVLNNLAGLYVNEGRYAEAATLLKRVLVIVQKALGPNHPHVATTLDNLARIYVDEGRDADAEALYKRAIEINEKTLGPDNPDVAKSLNNLAVLYDDESHYAKAQALYQRALAIDEKTLGPNHPLLAADLSNMAGMYEADGQYAKAGPLYQRALKIDEKVLGPDSPRVAQDMNLLALLDTRQQRYPQALALCERARQVLLKVRKSNLALSDRSLEGVLSRINGSLTTYVLILSQIAANPSLDSNEKSPRVDAFTVAEQERSGVAQAALARAAARSAVKNPAISAQARALERLADQRRAIQKRLQAELSKPQTQRNAAQIASLQSQRQTIDQQFATANEQLLSIPRYAELLAPAPATPAETAKLLRPGEALISFFTIMDWSPKSQHNVAAITLVWLIIPGKPLFYRAIAPKRGELEERIRRLRASLAPGHPYDVGDAFALYKLLLQPFASQLSGVKHLIIVPGRVLLPVPFAALVTSNKGQAYATLADDYKNGLAPSPAELDDDYPQIAWLAKQNYSIALMPSATALRMVREIASSKRQASEPMIGIGNPLLNGKGNERGGAMLVSRSARCADEVRQLCRLPGTRKELLAEAHALGANPARDLFMGARATKAMVTKLNDGRLGNVRVVSFATHALTGGDVTGLVGPALVLTPPAHQTPDDNGLLTLNDILGLHLDAAQWVVLSACNTEGGNDGLSALVRGFFYAGAPALLVSQWSVDDDATDHLMTLLFSYYGEHPHAARADALQHAMIELMSGKKNGGHDYFANPFAWAPFVVVGDGGPAN